MTTIGIPVMTSEEVARVVKAARKAGRGILEDGKRRVEANGVDVETRLEEGHAVEEIVRLSKEGGYDLIVMGARGISRIREILLGSVSESVMHHAACPVLIVK
jgi:nucleotide-binding universal stress UspA family protein